MVVAVVAVVAVVVAAGCAPVPSWQPGDLVVVDADAGGPAADGAPEPFLGKVFVFRRAPLRDDPRVLADTERVHLVTEITDPRWHEPVDVLPRRDGSLLVLDSTAPHPAHTDARGAIFEVRSDGEVREWWRDARARHPVSLIEHRGSVLVVDRSANPSHLPPRPSERAEADAAGRLAQRATGCVFELVGGDPGATKVLVADERLVTPGALLSLADGRLLLLDADANPDGVDGTPGVLFEVDGASGELTPRLVPHETTSPIGLAEVRPGEIYLFDANAGRGAGREWDGALFLVVLDAGTEHLELVLDTATLGRPRALVDPALCTVVPGGQLAVADANADPLGLGADGTGKGVGGTGRGCVSLVDPVARRVDVLVARRDFATPVSVRRVPE